MSRIDDYKHQLLGFIECPSSHDFVYGNDTRKIAIYELLEDIGLDEKDFDGTLGDILLGGGSGEAPAFRVTMPSSIKFFFDDDWNNFNNYDDLFKHFWTANESFILCGGFSKIGWSADLDNPIEFWLAKQICALLVHQTTKYEQFKPLVKIKSELKLL